MSPRPAWSESIDPITRLYPLPAMEIPLEGAYLAHHLRHQAETTGRPFVYANFVASLDGRIAIPRQGEPGMTVPESTTNERDWRLYQELAAQADILLSSGRYLRERAKGRAQEILQVDDPRFADLRAWREDNGLPAHPDIAILSASLVFPIPPELTAGGRKACFITTANAGAKRVAELEALAGQVIIAGKDRLDGALMVQRLAERGYRTIYSAAGPRVLRLLAAGGVLDRLYFTLVNTMLGGRSFATLMEGDPLVRPYAMKTSSIYLDPTALGGVGQLFIAFDRV